MKAIMHEGLGGPERLRLVDAEDKRPGPKEIKVRLKSAGLNHRDLFVMQDRPMPDCPWIPGSDGAGTIEEIGAEAEGFSVGKEVVIHPALGWNLTVDLPQFPDILGGPTDGTFAESVIVPAENVFPKPVFLSWAEAGVLPLSALTAYHALFSQGKLQAGEHLLIPGIGGGVATYALMMAKAAGESVTVTSRSQQKLRKATEMGADHGVDNGADWTSDRNMRKADLILDSIGGAVFSRFFPLLNPRRSNRQSRSQHGSANRAVAARIVLFPVQSDRNFDGQPGRIYRNASFYRNLSYSPCGGLGVFALRYRRSLREIDFRRAIR